MTFSEQEIMTLSTWEQHFDTALNADWSRNPGRTALQTIHSIFTKATGDRRRYNDNCQRCILNLLKDCGRIYFADKAMLLDQKNDAEAVKKTRRSSKKGKSDGK